MFKSSILNFVRPRENSVFTVYDINGLKFNNSFKIEFWSPE